MTDQIFNPDDFFAPASSDLVDNLMGRYTLERQKIESLAAILSDDDSQLAVGHFLSGNQRNEHYRSFPAIGDLFARDGALAHLNATYWQKALLLTDVLDVMPAKRREEWNDNIREMSTPDFEEESVRATLMDMLNSRARFFSERVDGIFRALSGEHVTNRPEGFSKRMILSGVYDQWGMSNYKMVNYVLDLRQVIAKFMGRPEPSYELTNKALKAARDYPGEWMSIDGGEMRIRAYLKGTAHFEIHPDIAWRLNCILASLYPTAIPPEFRAKPKKKIKDFVLMQNVLSVAVLQDLCQLEIDHFKPVQRGRGYDPIEPKTTNPFNRIFRGSDEDRHVRKESERILSSIGGIKLYSRNWSWWEFEYDPTRVLEEIIASGCVPDDKSHQFYPTPPELAKYCVQLANIEPGHTCLEPSAGHGSIAELMPLDQTICVEISPLKCQVLDSKGLRVYEADFLKWSTANGGCFDRIVMNPPFADGRAVAHLKAAAALTKTGSRIVAILPASLRGNNILPDDWNCTWSEPRSGEFSGTSVSVVVLTAERQWKK